MLHKKNPSDEGCTSKHDGFKGMIVCKPLKWTLTLKLGSVIN